MPGYISAPLHRFQHRPPARPPYDQHTCNKTVYGKHIQLANQKSSALKLNSVDKNIVQCIGGNLLYYPHAVDPTMINDLNKISTCQSVPTQYTMAKYNQVLDYPSTHTNATIRYHASGMILIMDIDAD